MNPSDYLKGKGVQINPKNKFNKLDLDTSDYDGLDEPLIPGRPETQVFHEHPKKIISEFNLFKV